MIIGGLNFIIKSSIQACLLWIVALIEVQKGENRFHMGIRCSYNNSRLIAVSLTATKLIDLLKMILIWDLGYPICEKSGCIDP